MNITKPTFELFANIMLFGVRLLFLIFYVLCQVIRRKEVDLADYFKWIDFK